MIEGVSPETEIWGINAAHYFLQRKAHYWFQIHPREWTTSSGPATGYFGRPKEHFDWLQKFNGTLWLGGPDRDFPNSKVYPLAEITRHFGKNYLTSTFAYQLALALYEHLNGQTIGSLSLYGINLTASEEYAHQRPCAEYWIGRLEQAGVEVTIPAVSSLLKGPVYPREGNDLARHAYDRLQHWKDNYMVAWANANTILAMQAELNHWAVFLAQLEEKHKFDDGLKKEIQERGEKRNTNFQVLVNRYTADCNGANGVVNDCQHFLTLLGGTDFKAARLPELRVPSVKLEGDFDLPSEAKRI